MPQLALIKNKVHQKSTQDTWILLAELLVISCVILNKALNFFEPEIFHLLVKEYGQFNLCGSF